MRERTTEGPWTVVAADVMRPFPRSKNRHRYVLVFQDLFTKYVKLRPLRTATGATIAVALGELTTVPPYHAQTSPVERVNRTLKTMIISFVEDDHRNWDVHLLELCFALNTAVQSSTQMTPAFLNLGRHPRPAKSILKELPAPPYGNWADSAVWNDRMQRLPLIHDWARKNLSKTTSRQAGYYNRGRVHREYNLVRRRNRVLSSTAQRFAAKLAPRFKGLYKITAKLSPVVYRIRIPGKRTQPKVHTKNLLPYHPPLNPPGPMNLILPHPPDQFVK
ncbi:uncharacterized protein LOC143430537 [Xylocopa sonorina]|uniref:uncharacterized protein LOC143430537 n=1 Tax=Xylocopa sonorina TaxID=1818115 RepID=UPI00403A96F7